MARFSVRLTFVPPAHGLRMEPERARATPTLEDSMPYKTISDLPESQVDQYTHHQKKAFLEAFNSAFEEYHHLESKAFAVAHHAAKQAGKTRGD